MDGQTYNRDGVANKSLIVFCLAFVITLFVYAPGIYASKPSPDGKADLTEVQKKELRTQRELLKQQVTDLSKSGRLDMAVELAEGLREINLKLYGKDVYVYVASLNQIADLHIQRRDFAPARKARVEILEIKTKKYGEKHWRVTDARLAVAHVDQLATLDTPKLHQLAQLEISQNEASELLKQKRYNEAISARDESLKIIEKILGSQTLEYAGELNRMGVLYSRVSRNEKAEKHFRQSFEIYEKLLGNDHPEVALLLKNLGYITDQQKDYENSMNYYRKAIRISKTLYGKRHKTYLDRLGLLENILKRYALFKQQKNDYAVAYNAWQQLTEVKRELFGESHYKVTDTRLLMERADKLRRFGVVELAMLSEAESLSARAYEEYKKKKYKDAIAIRLKVLSRYENLFGPNGDPETARQLNLIGVLYSYLDDNVNSEVFYKRALAMRKKLLGTGHPDVAVIMNNLGILQEEKKDHQAAADYYRSAFEIRDQVFGRKHEKTRLSLEYLTEMLEDSVREKEAVNDYLSTLAIQKELIHRKKMLWGTSHWKVTNARVYYDRLNKIKSLGREVQDELKKITGLVDKSATHFNKKEYQESLGLLEEAEAIHKKTLGENFTQYAQLLNKIGVAYSRMGLHARAQMLHKKALQIYGKLLGKHHPEIALMYDNLGYFYGQMADHVRSVENYQQAVKIRKQVFGEKDKGYIKSLKSLIDAFENQGKSQIGKGDFKEAKKTFQEVLSLKKSVYTNTQWEITDSRLDLENAERLSGLNTSNRRKMRDAHRLYETAKNLRADKAYEKAIDAVKKSISITKEILGDQDIVYGERIFYLGEIYFETKKYREAVLYYEISAPIYQNHLGRLHPDYGINLNNIGASYHSLNDYLKAEPYYRKALTIYEKTLNLSHVRTIRTLKNIAIVLKELTDDYMEKQDFNAVYNTQKENLSVKIKLYKENHWEVTNARSAFDHAKKLSALSNDQVNALSEVNTLERQMDKLEQHLEFNAAIPLACQVFEARQQIFGSDDTWSIKSLIRFAEFLDLSGDHNGALQYYTEALAIRQKVLGKDHPDTVVTIFDIGKIKAFMGDFKAAKPYYEETLRLRKIIFGDKHYKTIAAQNDLQSLEKAMSGSLDGYNPLTSKKSALMDKAIRHLRKGGKLFDQGRRVEAFSEGEKTLAIYRYVYGNISEDVAEQLESAAIGHVEASNLSKALTARKEVFDIQIKLHGKGHWKATDARQKFEETEILANLSPAKQARFSEKNILIKNINLFNKQKEYSRAIPLAKQVLQIYRDVFGPGHLKTGIVYSWLAVLYSNADDTATAMDNYRKKLSIQKNKLGSDHPDVADTLNYIAILLQETGDLTEAKTYFEQALAIRKKVFKKQSPEYAVILNNLGNLFIDMGDYVSSFSYFNEALAIRKKVLGPAHSDTAGTLNSMGVLSIEANNLPLARQYLEQAISIWKKSLGPEHPSTAVAIGNIGRVLKEMGDYEEARQQLETALAIQKKIWGPAHPSNITTLNNLAGLYNRMEDYQTAAIFCLKAFEISEKNLDKKHPDYILTADNIQINYTSLALVYEKKGDFKNAHKVLQEALDLMGKVYPKDHWRVANTRLALGYSDRLATLDSDKRNLLPKADQLVIDVLELNARGKLDDAMNLADQSVAIIKDILGSDHRETAIGYSVQGLVHSLKGDFQKSEALFLKALKILKELFGETHPDYASVLDLLGSVYNGMGKHDQAEALYEQSLTILGLIYGVNNTEYLQPLGRLGGFYQAYALKLEKQKTFLKAIQARHKVLGIQTRLHGPDHWKVNDAKIRMQRAKHLSNLSPAEQEMLIKIDRLNEEATRFYKQGEFAKVIATEKIILEIRRQIFTDKFSDTAESFIVLANQFNKLKEYTAAKKHLESALHIKQNVFGLFHPETASCMDRLGMVVQDMGYPLKAKVILAKALAINEQIDPESIDTSTRLNNLGLIEQDLGNTKKAMDYYEKALVIRRNLLGTAHTRTALVLRNLGRLLMDIGDKNEALSYMKQAYSIYKKNFPSGNPNTARIQNDLGYLSQEMGDFEGALKYFTNSLNTNQRLFGDESDNVAFILKNIGNLYTDMGDYQKAEGFLEKALAMYEKKLGEHPDTALCLNHLGRLFRLSGDFQKAIEYFELSYDVIKKANGPEHISTAQALNSLALVMQNMGNYDAAKSYYEKSLKITQKSRGENHPDFAVQLDHIGDNLRQIGFYDIARQYLEQALDIFLTEFGTDHPNTSRTLMSLGLLYYEVGDYPTAREHLERALQINRKLWGDAHLQVSLSLNYLGIVVQAMGDGKAALPLWEESLFINQKIWGENHHEVTTSLNNLAHLLMDTDPDKADTYFTRELNIYKTRLEKEDSPTAKSLLQVARQLRKMKRYKACLPYYEKALLIQKKKLGPEHPHFISILFQVGKIHALLEEYETARPYYEQALEITRKVKGSKDLDVAYYSGELGKLLTWMGEEKKARPYFDNAISIYEKIRGSLHLFNADILKVFGTELRVAGDFKTAKLFYEKALDIHMQILGKEHRETADTRLQFSHLLAASGDVNSAWTQLTMGAASYAKMITRTLATQTESEHLAISGQSRFIFEGLLSLVEKKPAIAQQYGNELMSAIFDWKASSSQALLVRQEAMVLEQNSETANIYKELKEVRNTIIRTRLQGLSKHKLENKMDIIKRLRLQEDTLERDLSKRVKAYAKIKQNVRAGPDVVGRYLGDDSALIEFVKYRRFYFESKKGEDDWGEERYAAIVYLKPPQKEWLTDFTKAQNESRRTGKPILAHFHAPWAGPSVQMRKEVLNDPQTFKFLNANFVPVNIDITKQKEVASRFKIMAIPTIMMIDADGNVVNSIKGYKDKGTFLSWAGKTGKKKASDIQVHYIVLGKAKKIDRLIREWRAAVLEPAMDLGVEKNLREAIWAPLANVLPQTTKQLYIAPDGELSLIPFGAIKLADGRYLIEEIQLSYLSNGRDLIPRLKPPDALGPPLIVTNPDYNLLASNASSASSTFQPSLPAGNQKRSSLVETQNMYFESLPGFDSEAEAISGAWQKARPNESIEILKGSHATEEKLMALNSPRILHLITHGFFLPDLELFSGREESYTTGTAGKDEQEDAKKDDRGLIVKTITKSTKKKPKFREDARLRSGLALAGANRWQRRMKQGQSDGLLTAFEVRNLNLWGTQLVVLSACETGLGKVEVGEGVMGLRRAFQQAGAETVLASLWKVPDEETKKLMTRFFNLWLSGMSKSEALHKAQLELIQEFRQNKNPVLQKIPPFYWAAFICHGKPD